MTMKDYQDSADYKKARMTNITISGRKGKTKTITLQELTGQESGIVIYESKGANDEGIICNWSRFNGLPRVFATGLIDWPTSIAEAVDGEHYEDLSEIFDGVEIIYNPGVDELPQIGTVYEVTNDEGDRILVVAPDGWN